mmetsp:Transcript_37831/g.69509  ORF Transcript_37831/g.69509 Transcript_37831/m.69509 type:complete len:227 (+) Transcript_37831:3-683(+)
MPMAYVQFMEVLVDTLIVLAPMALYVKMGTFNIISTGLLTLFFKGLLELSKSFLDPFGREGYRAHNIRVDVLVSELNFGASSRWVEAGDALPSELLERNESKQSSERTKSKPFTECMLDSQGGSFAECMAQDSDLPIDESTDADVATEIEANVATGIDANVATGIEDSGPGIDNSSDALESNGKSSGDVDGSDISELLPKDFLKSVNQANAEEETMDVDDIDIEQI